MPAARAHEELEWVLDFWDPAGDLSVKIGGRHVQLVEVPRGEWEVYSSIPLGVDAPELLAQNMLTTAGVARRAGLSESTVTAHLARGEMPEPQLYVARTPLWAHPIIGRWLDGRR